MRNRPAREPQRPVLVSHLPWAVDEISHCVCVSQSESISRILAQIHSARWYSSVTNVAMKYVDPNLSLSTKLVVLSTYHGHREDTFPVIRWKTKTYCIFMTNA